MIFRVDEIGFNRLAYAIDSTPCGSIFYFRYLMLLDFEISRVLFLGDAGCLDSFYAVTSANRFGWSSKPLFTLIAAFDKLLWLFQKLTIENLELVY